MLLKRAEALAVLQEIFESFREMANSSVSIDPEPSLIYESEPGYRIRMSCVLDKHGLELKEEKGFVVIGPSMKEA